MLYGGSPTATPTPILPSEIQQQIIDIIFGPDLKAGPSESKRFIKTLVSCALVCQSWNRRVVWHQFREASLDIATEHVSFRFQWPPEIHLAEMLELLEVKSFLRKCIRLVTITNLHEDPGSLSSTDIERFDPLVAQFCHILSPYADEVRLTLFGEGENSFPHRLGALHTLKELCSGPRLHCLTLTSSVPVPSVLTARHLKTLKFDSCDAYLDQAMEPTIRLEDMPSDGGAKADTSDSLATLSGTAPDEPGFLQEFIFETQHLSPDEATFSYELLWKIVQGSPVFLKSLSGLRRAKIDVPLTPLPTGLSEVLFSEHLQELSLYCDPQEFQLSETLSSSFASIHWASLANLTTLALELSLGLRDEIWTVLRYVKVEKWVEKPPSDFLLACSELPSLQNFALQVTFSSFLVFINLDSVSGGIDHVFKNSVDPYLALPRFRTLKKLALGTRITVQEDGKLFHSLSGGAFDRMANLSLPSVFGPDGRASNGLEVSLSCQLDLHDVLEEDGERPEDDDDEDEDEDSDDDDDNEDEGSEEDAGSSNKSESDA